MSRTELTVGEPMPRIGTVKPLTPFNVAVEWSAGPRSPGLEIVDLAPSILKFKIYAPLRNDGELFKAIRIVAEGTAIVWGPDGAIDMAATTVEELASKSMTAADFKAFLERHNLTLDQAAAELGISRRQVAYYEAGKLIPRYIALACAYLDGAQRATAQRSPAEEYEPGIHKSGR